MERIRSSVVAAFAHGLVILGQTKVIRAGIFFITYQGVIVVVSERIRVVSAVSVAEKLQIRVNVVNSITVNVVISSDESAMVFDQIVWMIVWIVVRTSGIMYKIVAEA